MLVLDPVVCCGTTEYVHALHTGNANTSAWFSNITYYQNLVILYFLISCLWWSSSEVEGERQQKPRQYICHGDTRKTSERFRTQPVTFAEHQEADRYGPMNDWMTENQDYVKSPCDQT